VTSFYPTYNLLFDSKLAFSRIFDSLSTFERAVTVFTPDLDLEHSEYIVWDWLWPLNYKQNWKEPDSQG